MALTMSEVAARLNVPLETVHRWVRQGKIPMQRRGDSYVIRREMLERWADEHKLEIQDRTPREGPQGAEQPEFDSILEAMQRGGVFYDVEGADRESALRSAVQHIPNIAANERSLLFDKLLERELLASTGIGHGIALPHPRSHLDIALASPQITTCFLDRSVPYDAIDGQPVRVLMVLLSRSTQQHLVMLSKLSFFLRDPDYRRQLSTQPSRSEIFDKIAELESKRE
jgi:PTS system nitrogen regulatory IIA component